MGLGIKTSLDFFFYSIYNQEALKNIEAAIMLHLESTEFRPSKKIDKDSEIATVIIDA